MQEEEEKKEEEESKETEEEKKIQQKLDFVFLDVICGNRCTIGIINEPPYLLQWGGMAEASHSKQYQEFELDKPLKIDCGGQIALI